jgi:hypothetical protein
MRVSGWWIESVRVPDGGRAVGLSMYYAGRLPGMGEDTMLVSMTVVDYSGNESHVVLDEDRANRLADQVREPASHIKPVEADARQRRLEERAQREASPDA